MDYHTLRREIVTIFKHEPNKTIKTKLTSQSAESSKLHLKTVLFYFTAFYNKRLRRLLSPIRTRYIIFK